MVAEIITVYYGYRKIGTSPPTSASRKAFYYTPLMRTIDQEIINCRILITKNLAEYAAAHFVAH